MTIQELILGQKVYANGSPINIDPNNNTTTRTPSTTPTPTAPQPTTPTINTDPNQQQTLPTDETLNIYNKCGGYYGDLYVSGEGANCKCKQGNNSSQEVNCSLLTSKDFSYRCINIKGSNYNIKSGQCECPNGQAKDGEGNLKNECLVNKAGTLGIKCTPEQLINNTCSRNINKTLGIRQSDPTPNPTVLLQDMVLAATSFVGTLIMIALVYLGFKAVMAGAGDSDELGNIKSKAQSLAIGLLLIVGSYSAIRLIQYIARGY